MGFNALQSTVIVGTFLTASWSFAQVLRKTSAVGRSLHMHLGKWERLNWKDFLEQTWVCISNDSELILHNTDSWCYCWDLEWKVEIIPVNCSIKKIGIKMFFTISVGWSKVTMKASGWGLLSGATEKSWPYLIVGISWVQVLTMPQPSIAKSIELSEGICELRYAEEGRQCFSTSV